VTSSTLVRIVGAICIAMVAFIVTRFFIGDFTIRSGQSTDVTTAGGLSIAPDGASAEDSGNGPCDAANRVPLAPPFGPDGEFSFVAPLPKFNALADSNDAPNRSKLLLCEDGKPLGPPHSQHVDIQKQGLGRYLHWETIIYFSSSDNSDPNANSHSYSVIVDR
jgi:hypothetical protein